MRKNKIKVLFNQISIMIPLFLLVLLVGGCGKNSSKIGWEEGNSGNSKTAIPASPCIQELDIVMPEIVNYYRVLPDGRVPMLLVDDQAAFSFALFDSVNDREMIRVTLSESFGNFCYYDETDSIYIFNESKKQIEERTLDFTTKRKVTDLQECFEIREMFCKDGQLFILYIEDNPYLPGNEPQIDEYNHYFDFGERFCRVDLDTGKVSDYKIDGLISVFFSETGVLYAYSYNEGHYQLTMFSLMDGSQETITETDEVGYLFSFAIVGNQMVYYGLEKPGLRRLDLDNHHITTELVDFDSGRQSDLNVIGEEVIYLNRNEMKIASLHIGGDLSVFEDPNGIVIGCIGSGYIPFSVEEVFVDGKENVKVRIYENPEAEEAGDFAHELLLKLMAGDEDIDVYFLYMNESFSEKLTLDGVCQPLNESEYLSAENGSYFDYLGQKLRTESGAIWGVPIRISGNVMIYRPEIMEQAGLEPEKCFSDYFTLMETLEALDGNSDFEIFINADEYGQALIQNYNTNERPTDFETQRFHDFFESMWSGWVRYENMGTSQHPLMGGIDEEEQNVIGLYERAKRFDAGKGLFQMASIETLRSCPDLIKNTRAYPLPLISSEYSQTVNMMVAVVNPHGKNCERAIRYLEHIVSMQKESGQLGFVYKDYEKNKIRFEENTELSMDLYNIAKDSVVTRFGIVNEIATKDITAYQHGEVDLENLLEEIQRKAEMSENE